MASPSNGHDGKTGGVEFLLEQGGRITARDTETGIASYGESKAEALRMLAEALEVHDGGEEPVSEDDLQELGLDPVTWSRQSSERPAVRTRTGVQSSGSKTGCKLRSTLAIFVCPSKPPVSVIMP